VRATRGCAATAPLSFCNKGFPAMIKPEFATPDDALEYAAQLVEEMHFGDLRGIMAKKKRDREDAALRVDTIKKTRKEMAAHIRAFKDRPDLSLVTLLREAENLCGVGLDDSIILARGGWQLASKGWVKVTMTAECTTNQIPPPVHFEVRITDKGRTVLAEADAKR
jgi:hypothetical protein